MSQGSHVAYFATNEADLRTSAAPAPSHPTHPTYWISRYAQIGLTQGGPPDHRRPGCRFWMTSLSFAHAARRGRTLLARPRVDMIRPLLQPHTRLAVVAMPIIGGTHRAI